MDEARTIRQCITEVMALRQLRQQNDLWRQAILEIKELQSQRFRGSYADLLQSPCYAPAAQFFLDELYGSSDYAARDTQFARIAGTLETLFPPSVVDLAVLLAQLHARTEALDHALAQAWPATRSKVARYVQAWRTVGEVETRQWQLQSVLHMGERLAHLTAKPGLRTMLRMMRKPACAAGLSELQRFLESGFETFGALVRTPGAVTQFLTTIEARETALIDVLFHAPLVTCETQLAQTLGQAR